VSAAAAFAPAAHAVSRMRYLPRPRGDVSDALLRGLSVGDAAGLAATPVRPDDPLADDDLHLALFLAYELHYRGLPGVDDEREWDPDALGFRRRLERIVEDALRDAVGREPAPAPEEVPALLRALAREADGPFSRYLERSADLAAFREFLVHRSAYHLKEADPHSFAIPRLAGPPKAAFAEIQADEYGGGDGAWMHSFLFARAMAGLGLDPTYGAYLDRIPGHTLATVNLMSLFGLHRRWRAAAVGHLALFELTSTTPNRRYGNGLRRLGLDADTTRFFDEHVEADAVHEAIAANDLAGGLVRFEPALTGDVVFGARALLLLDDRNAARMMAPWTEGRSSLLPGTAPLPGAFEERGRVA